MMKRKQKNSRREFMQNSAIAGVGLGASDKNVCEVIFGNSEPRGKLPFELPSSMEAVRNQLTNVPYDSEQPLFPFGHGLTY